MAELKKVWKQTAKSFILAFNDLGISLVDTAKAGADYVVEWAKKDNPHVQAEGTEIPCEEEPAAEPTAEPAEAPEAKADSEADKTEE